MVLAAAAALVPAAGAPSAPKAEEGYRLAVSIARKGQRPAAGRAEGRVHKRVKPPFWKPD